MPRKVEPLNGGLVTDRDPMLLKPGQLANIRNMVYKNGAVVLERAPGRAVFGAVSATATAVAGLRDMHFDSGDHFLVAMAGTKYRTAPMGDTGTFSDLATIASGTSLEVVQYRNRFFLMNGSTADATAIGTNVVVYQSATAAGTPLTTRNHGLLPVNAAPNITTAGGGQFSQTATGYFEYWTTELSHFTQDGADNVLESAFSSDNGVSTIFISATSVVPSVQLPAVRNATTTHWRVYRSPKKTLNTDKEFPIGFMVGEMSTGASAFADTTAVASASSFPASGNNSGYFSAWTSTGTVTADDNVYASGTVGANVAFTEQGFYAFSLGGFVGAVKGIAVEFQAYISAGSAPLPVRVAVGKRDSTTGTWKFGRYYRGHEAQILPIVGYKSAIVTGTNSASPQTITVGGSTDRWFPTDGTGLNDSDFDSTVMVAFGISKPNTSIGVDYLKLYIYYGASLESTVVYPTVVYTFGDITAQESKNLPAPSSNTGDLYQDALVVNDMSNPSLIRYSFPGLVDSFPPSYYLDFETRENDIVRHIRVVNNRLVVGLDTSLWRVNYLPSERDASFDRGKAVEMISRSLGIVNPMCACTFTIDGQTEQLAFVSNKGVHTTDAYNFITRTKNQAWRNYISLTSTSTPIALLNDPENRTLRFYYRNDSLGNETFMCLWLSYDSADVDSEGNFKVSGPCHVRNFDPAAGGTYASVESAWAVPRAGGNTGIYIGYGGTSVAAGAAKVYFETGTTIPSNDDTAQYTTRRIYEAGITGEWMLDDLYGYCGNYSGSPLLTYTFSGTKTNDSGATTRGSKAITLRGQKLHKVTPKVQVEGLQITMQASNAGTFSQEMLVLGSTEYGREDAGT